jgi:hypothetical protein
LQQEDKKVVMDKYSKNLLVISGKYDSSKDYWLNK